jgi:ATP-dependent DNA helicase DinG
MCEAVSDALRGGSRLLVEAGTGTGKSFAYLIPLIEHALKSEERAVVSTYTKALQRQLVEKDLPFIKERLYPHLRFALGLGSENYLCLRRLDQARDRGLFTEDADEVEALARFAARSESGLREGQPLALWRKVAREADLCLGRECRHFERCFYYRARAEQRRSHILVVNHHMYFAHLGSGLNLLPPFETAVFDEAHEVEDVAATYMSTEAANLRLFGLLGAVLSARGTGVAGRLRWIQPADLQHLGALVTTVRLKAEEFFVAAGRRLGAVAVRIREPEFVPDTLSEHLDRLGAALDALGRAAPEDDDAKDLAALGARARDAAGALRAILGQTLGEEFVYWGEQAGRSVRLVATPVSVANLKVFEPLKAAVLTSATLSTGGGFTYIKERLGLESAREMLVPAHFDYRSQAALYIARDMPDPRSEEFEPRAIARIGEILELAGGATLVLFTSHAFMNRAHEALASALPAMRIGRQGEAESYELVERFRRGELSALFGTQTFWQGIDVPGEALRCVVITKLPFAAPDDPVVEARLERLKKDGRDPFRNYQVPRAAILLKQGFGRLIRSAGDRGLVAVLDSRIVTRNYGKYFLRSLPDVPLIERLADAAPLLRAP